MSASTLTILQEILRQKKVEISPSSSDDEFFSLFTTEQVLKEFELDYDELKDGIVDGGGDGGIDGIFTFVNGELLEEDSDSLNIKKDIVVDLIIIQSKNTGGYTEESLNKLNASAVDLLNFSNDLDDLRSTYNEELRKKVGLFRNIFLKFASRFPKLNISCFYCTLGSEPHPNVLRKVEQLNKTVSLLLNDCNFTFNFIGVNELLALARKKPLSPKDEKKIPEFVLKLAEGCSTYAKLAAKYWIACALISIVTLSVNSSSGTTKLPFDLPELNKADFFPFMFLIISVLFIVFGSATAQAVRARWLINRYIYKPEHELVFPADIHLPDIIDAILYPAINRVAPLAQILQLKNRFLPEAGEVSSLRKRRFFQWYYGFLKLVATLVLYGLPSLALGYCVLMIYRSGACLSWMTDLPLWIAGSLAMITLVTLIVLDTIYTSDAIKKIGMKKIKQHKL